MYRFDFRIFQLLLSLLVCIKEHNGTDYIDYMFEYLQVHNTYIQCLYSVQFIICV